MSDKKAKLTIVLKADTAIVAEVENPILWQKVLLAIHNDLPFEQIKSNKKELDVLNEPEVKFKSGNPLNRLAKQIGINESVLEGAVSPTIDPPYLHLDRHCWEAMKKNTPSRGKGAISPTAMAATLLCLWFNEINLGSPTQVQSLAVLKSIGIIDKNSSRGIKGTPWLQGRPSGVVIINPAQISKANNVAKSFCTKNWSQKEELIKV